MSTPIDKMKCTNCDAEMNHHADKVIYEVENEDEQPYTTVEQIIQEFYTCPACGRGASRRVGTTPPISDR